MAERRVDDTDDNYETSVRTGTEVVASVVMRDYRKGNWTVSETMVLIEAKKMEDERRTVKRSPGMGGGGGGGGVGKVSMEPRWKWVEDYCWRKGCYRSQNQCNDKWDNLMRDYKKVRDYERRRMGNGEGARVESGVSSSSSYWKMEKTERKERNLPANMILQIYEALVDIVERKGGGSTVAVATTSQLLLPAVPTNSVAIQPVTLSSPPPHQQKSYIPSPALVMVSDQPALTLPSGLPPTLVQQEGEEPRRQQAFAASRPPQSTRESEDTGQEQSDSPAKRRRRTVAGGGGGTSKTRDVGAAITIGATAIAEAIQANGEREERRHRDIVSLQERRLRAEEAKNEINRQGMNGLVEAINRLATSIQALASSSSSSKNIDTTTTTNNNNKNNDDNRNQPEPPPLA